MISNIGSKATRTLQRGFSSAPASQYVPRSVHVNVTDESVTKNGVHVATETMAGETATVGVYVGAGSRNDKVNGTARFLEEITAKRIASEIHALGGNFNSFTTRERTGYSATVLKKDAAKALQVISDAVQNPKFDDLEKHRAGLVQQAERASQEWVENLMEHLHETAFLNNDLGRPIRGTAESLQAVTRENISEFWSSHYHGQNAVVSAAGAVEHKDVAAAAESSLAGLKAHGSSVAAAPAVFVGSDKRMRFDTMPAAHIALAFRTDGANSEHVYPLKLMAAILGSWDVKSAVGRNSASKFAQACSEFELVSSYSTFNKTYKDSGLFGLHMVAPDNKLNDVMWYALDSMVRLVYNVTDAEIERAKVQLKSHYFIEHANTSSIANANAHEILTFGRKIPHSEAFARIDALTAGDVNVTANKFINDEDHALAAAGPLFELPDYNWIRRRSYWNRY